MGFMTSVKALRRLPSLGHTTAKSFKLWARCSKNGQWKIALKVLDTIGNEVFNGELATNKKLSNSGVIEITDLQPSTTYFVYIGRVKSLSDLDWQNITPLTVKTFPSEDQLTQTKFTLTSCRHPAQLLSAGQKNAMLNIMHERMQEAGDFDFRIACGDQIYADHPFTVLSNGTAPKSYKGFARRYLKNYNRAHNRVASKMPTYCTFDDHELVNDWAFSDFTDQRSKKKKSPRDPRILNNGLLAYDTFQHALNPNFTQQALERRIDANYIANEFEYWYTFSHSQSGFFAMDTRYQRIEGPEFEPDENLEPTSVRNSFIQLIDPDTQLQDLKAFLRCNRHRVKFIVSAMPFVPDTLPEGIGHGRALFTAPFDKWKGGHRQRKEILDFIDQENIKNVFFLSGDVHCSFVAKVSKDGNTIAHNIISSALNWPIFGLGRNSFQLGPLYGAEQYNTDIISTCERTGSVQFVEKRNNYVEVVVSGSEVTITTINNLNDVSSVVRVPVEPH